MPYNYSVKKNLRLKEKGFTAAAAQLKISLYGLEKSLA
jgi:hypothetical protein